MVLSNRQLLDALSRTPFADSTELAGILGEPHSTIHRGLTGLLDDGIVGRVSHGTAHLPSSQRYFITANGIRETAGVLGFDTPSDYVRAYPMSREWLTLLMRRMDAVAAVYRMAAALSPGIDGLRTNVEFHRRGRFDATITLHDGRSFGVVRQGLALRRRSLYDRLRAIAEYDYTRRPGTVLVLVPSVWGGETDGAVLRGAEHPGLLRRRGVQGCGGEGRRPRLAERLVPDRRAGHLAGRRGLPHQPRRRALYPVAGAEAGFPARP